MSTNSHDSHSGKSKISKSDLWLIIAAAAIIIFAYFDLSKSTLTYSNAERDVAERIQKVGSVQFRDAAKAVRAGEEVYKAQCSACHAMGVAGSPKFGDTAAWAPRLKNTFEYLVNSALKGKNAMSAQGGGEYSDLEIARAVAYMTSAAGGKFKEPEAPAPAPAAEEKK
jgi:cytochrome c5